MKKLTLIICLSMASGFAFSQWVQQNPKLSNPHLQLNSVFFTDSVTGYAVGKYQEDYILKGILLKTIDGGSKWDTLWRDKTSENTTLSSVFFTDKNTGYAAGYETGGGFGFLLKTTDGGLNWITFTTEFFFFLNSVFFIDSNNGYAVGGEIYKTIDGGLIWTTYSFASYNFNSIHFPDSNTGYAVGTKGIITKTSDGGSTWTKLSSEITNDLFSVYFIDSNTGFAVGNNIILKTSDGGLNWTTSESGFFPGSFYSVYFTDANTGYAVGACNIPPHPMQGGGCNWKLILKTIDRGVTWTNIWKVYNSGESLYSVFFADANTGYAVGENGTILKTTNGGGFPTPVEKVPLESTFTVYPNPATNKISIKNHSNLQGETTICIFNMNEAILKQEKFQSQNLIEMDLSALAKGIYLLQIQTNAGVETKKMVVQ